jgi:hypothetical protein
MTGDMKRGFTHRMALRMSDTDGSEFVLETRIPDASKLPDDPDSKGYGYVRESGMPRKFRAFWVPDVHIKDMASRAFEPDSQWSIGSAKVPAITAGLNAFPDGSEIPMSRQNLWESISENPVSAKDLADSAGMTVQGAKKILDEWAAKNYITKQGNKPATYNR